MWDGGPERPRLGPAKTDDRMAARAHAAETVEAGATQQVEKNGLGLVVGRVTGEDIGRQDGEPGFACPRLEVRARLHRRLLGSEVRSEPRRGGSHHLGLSARVGTEAVPDVHCRRPASGRARQHQQCE